MTMPMSPSNDHLLGLPLSTWKMILAVESFLNVAGWYWDGWWHVTLGFHTLYSGPHIIIYLHIAIFTIVTFMLYRRTGQRTYWYAFLAELVTIVAGFFDIAWHTWIGFEELISPLIVWSPPHMLAFLSTIAGWWFLLRDWVREFSATKDVPSFLRVVLLAGALFGILRVVVFPLEPLGWHHVWGLPGAFVTTGISFLFLLWLGRNMPGQGIITVTLMCFALWVSFEALSVAPGERLPAHVTLPHWIFFFAFFTSGLFADVVIRRLPLWLVGAGAAGVMNAVYLAAWQFVGHHAEVYPGGLPWVMLLAAMAGGLVAGLVLSRRGPSRALQRRQELPDGQKQ